MHILLHKSTTLATMQSFNIYQIAQFKIDERTCPTQLHIHPPMSESAFFLKFESEKRWLTCDCVTKIIVSIYEPLNLISVVRKTSKLMQVMLNTKKNTTLERPDQK